MPSQGTKSWPDPRIIKMYFLILASLIASVASGQSLCSSSTVSLLPLDLNSSATQSFSLMAISCLSLVTDFTYDAPNLCPDSLLLEAWITTDSISSSSSQQLSLWGPLIAASTTSTPDFSQIMQARTVSLTNKLNDVVSSIHQNGQAYQNLRIKTANSRMLYVALLNLNAFVDSVTFNLRASCVADSDPLPCPSQSPLASPCSFPQQGLCVSGTCQCMNGYGGFACSQKISSIQRNSIVNFPLQGKNWRFFNLDLLGLNNGVNNILVELTQPSGSYNSLQPLLIVTPINSSSYIQGYTPDLGDIPLSFLTPRDMSPNNWLSPWSLSYYFKESSQLSRYWSIGVFNAAPVGSNKASPSLPAVNVTLRVRASTNLTPSQRPSALCPSDCSGKGVCSYPTFFGNPTTLVQCSGNGVCTREGTDLANYLCQCNRNGESWYGSMCQASLKAPISLSSSRVYSLGPQTTTPGSIEFYQFSCLTTAAGAGRRMMDEDRTPSRTRRLLQNPSFSSFTFTLTLSTNAPQSSFLAAIQASPMKNATTLSFSPNGTTSFTVTQPVTYLDTIIIALVNNDMYVRSNVTYRLNVSWVGNYVVNQDATFFLANQW